ncbi:MULTISPECIES: SLC13 family permease [Halorubrum]|uniref:Citrate transporter n=1 Tax=Halorubrum hochstenium ATCC 700873 TaxID=1227481 RepID=M0FH10_9EURY|nr:MULTISPECIES: SLC13 family permease [Halorubrum]ELZ58618.1 Citrate transporter [Halorubrum hochstenium ATCC 700873]
MALLGLTTPALLVFGLIGVALALFVSEVIPNDVTAIGVIVALASIEPLLGIDIGITPRNAISGFSNPATITIVGMYMLSAGIQQTGLVQRLGVYLADLTQGSEFRALAATVGTTGPIAGFINNTPVVAVFIPMISDLAEQSNISPSKLLLPLSYAAILGGTLTLIGTSTNLLASDSARLLIDGRSGIGMFEFAPLGVVILVVGLAYLLTIGRRLVPARIPVGADLVEEFDLEDHLARVEISDDSPLVGTAVAELDSDETGVTILQLRRDGEVYPAPYTDIPIEAGDALIVNGTIQAINQFREANGLRNRTPEEITETTFEDPPTDFALVKAVVGENSKYVGETIAEARIEEFQRTTVLAIRREGTLIRTELDEVTLQVGDLLLARMPVESIEYFNETGDLYVADERAYDRLVEADVEEAAPLSPRTPIAVAIMAGVIAAASLDVVPIVIAAFAGVFGMVVTGCLSSADAYDAVSWNVIFLLAGVIPLGQAMESTGGAAVIAEALVSAEAVLPLIGVLLLTSLLTGLMANVITPVATVVLMIPVAVDAAQQLGADQFSFLLIVMFASATSFMTPIGYQTNLMVYGPGGYRFSDFLKVGAPLQVLLAVVTTVGVAAIWGL